MKLTDLTEQETFDAIPSDKEVDHKTILATIIKRRLGPQLTGEAIGLAEKMTFDLTDMLWALRRKGCVEFTPRIYFKRSRESINA